MVNKPRAELTDTELHELEEYEINHGPLALLRTAVKSQSSVIISLRNNHKLISKVKAFDRHCNMILENVKEVWQENSNGKSQNRERFVSKMFLRGDSVIVVLKYEG